MYSSYYILQKEAVDRRASDSRNLMSQIAAQRFSGIARSTYQNDEEFIDDASDASGQSQARPGKVADHTIINEASSRDEKSGSLVSEDLSEAESDKKDQENKEISILVGSKSDLKLKNSKPNLFGNFWSQVSDDNILLVVNIQGIQVMENSKRDRIVHHIDYEDILYVMGKGNRLKIGFQYNLPLIE